MRVTEAQLVASVCRPSLAEFVRRFWPLVAPDEQLIWNWHMDVLCAETQATYERIFAGLPRLHHNVTNISPGTTKSVIKSIMAPAWAWTRKANFAFLGASYTEDLALILAGKCRDVILSPLYQAAFPNIQIRDDHNMKGHFKLMSGGERKSIGAGGSVIGVHFHLIQIDDPINPNAVASEADLFFVNQWIKNTLFQRLKDKRISVIDLIMQRLHQDDPSANLLKRKRVRHICLPATTEFPIYPPELADKYQHGLMDPVRLPKEYLDEIRLPNELGEDGFACQFGQQPVPAGGGKFKVDRLRWGPLPEKWKRLARFWDHAASKYKTAAYTAGVLIGEDFQRRFWVINVERGQWDSYERETRKRRVAERDGLRVLVGQEEEPGSAGKDTSWTSSKYLAGFRVRFVRARGSKENRADAFSVQVNAGNVWLPEHYRKGNDWTGWAATYIDELKHWPQSTYKDQGDASGGAFNLVARRGYSGPLPKKGAKAAADGNQWTRRLKRFMMGRRQRTRSSVGVR